MGRAAGKPLNSFLCLLHPLSIAALCASSAHHAYDDTPSFGVAAITGGVGGGYEGELLAQRREEYGGGRIIDISHYYREDMPGWEAAHGLGKFLWLSRSMKDGDVAYFSKMKLPVHSGTHVDSPGHVFQHYYEAGFDVDTLDLEVLNGSGHKEGE